MPYITHPFKRVLFFVMLDQLTGAQLFSSNLGCVALHAHEYTSRFDYLLVVV
jgi:hypothetical protein